jgi:hypothetical protein
MFFIFLQFQLRKNITIWRIIGILYTYHIKYFIQYRHKLIFILVFQKISPRGRRQA